MNRRKFLGLGVMAAVAMPATLSAISAIDFRSTKPDTWTAHTTENAIKALYGDIKPVEEGVTIKLPKVASNGGAVPLTIKSDIKAKTVAVFQNMNPESAVAVFNVPEEGIIDYFLKIKLKGTDENAGNGIITVIVEGTDGKFYKGTKALQVAKGGCEG
jgi:sulfur-oxidizing protein SoxY